MNRLRRRGRTWISRSTQRARKLATILITPDYRDGLRHGVAAATEHHRAPHIREPRTVLDIGANRGQFALVARHRFPDAALLCFEPLPEPRERLERTVGGNGHVRVFPYALGDRSGSTLFRVSTEDDSSSLLPTTEAQRAMFPGSATAYEIDIEIRRLDDLIEPTSLARPILVKIDVQGTELDVLRGSGALRDVVDDLLIECSFIELYEGQPLVGEVIAFLSEWGMQVGGVHNVVSTPDGRCAQADLHFTRASP